MTRLLDWHTRSWKAKKKNWPMFEDLHNALPVNVPSAIVIAVGFPTSISLTDALSINTGSCVFATTIGMARAFLDALMLPAGPPLPMRQPQLRKARELSSLPFLMHLMIAESGPYFEYAAWAPLRGHSSQREFTSYLRLQGSNSVFCQRDLSTTRPIVWNLVH